MRVLLATDGMPCSIPAEDLVSTILWPRGSAITLLSVIPSPGPDEVAAEVQEAIIHSIRPVSDEHLRKLAARLTATGREVVTRTTIGRPATVIVEEAERAKADVIIVGNRGRGTFPTSLIGSVAAEVVDQAPCPVLIARTPRFGRILLADDASEEASAAAQLVQTWPIFQGLHARVVSVAPLFGVLASVPADRLRHENASEDRAKAVDAIRHGWAAIAHDRAIELERAGVHAVEDARVGDPAEEIVNASFEASSDVIVMGSRGRTGLQRVLLGSVARNVFTHARCSVLIARHGTVAP